MSLPDHVTITGSNQGHIKGSCQMKGRGNTIRADYVEHEIHIPSGEKEGKRVHSPVKITKTLDLSSPRLNQALASSEVLTQVRLLSYRIDETGHEEHYFTRILENARVVSLVLDMEIEEVAFSYEKITWRWEDPPMETSDTWDSQESWGNTLPAKPPKTKKASVTKAQDPVTQAPEQPSKDRFAGLSGVAPVSLTDAEQRLGNARQNIKTNGYQPKYTDEELMDMAKNGNVGDERFQVRFMEASHLQHTDTPNVPLSGAMGVTMTGATGKGAKYWSTSFDQIEDADTDPKLLSEKLGLAYNPDKDYTLIVVDTEKSMPLTGVKSVPATFEKVSEFANTELPKKFPKQFTNIAMTPEFQAKYAEHHAAAVKSGDLPNKWSKDTKKFEKYLKTTDLSKSEQKLLKTRMKMHDKIGNNCDYVGNGLTKDMINTSPNKFGVVETLNFERKEINLKALNDSGAIKIIKGLKRI